MVVWLNVAVNHGLYVLEYASPFVCVFANPRFTCAPHLWPNSKHKIRYINKRTRLCHSSDYSLAHTHCLDLCPSHVWGPKPLLGMKWLECFPVSVTLVFPETQWPQSQVNQKVCPSLCVCVWVCVCVRVFVRILFFFRSPTSFHRSVLFGEYKVLSTLNGWCPLRPGPPFNACLNILAIFAHNENADL